MPSRAFIITLNVDSIDPQSLQSTAEEIHSDLTNFDVVSVRPWVEPSPTLTLSTPPVGGTTTPITGVN